MDAQRVAWKIAVLGQPESGKSSLVSRIVYDTDSGPTKQRGIVKKKMTLQGKSGKVIADLLFLELQDSDGVEKLLTGSNCILIAVDITKPDELEVSKDIIKYLKSHEETPLLVLVGTKSDLKYEAAVWENDFEKVKKEFNVDYFIVSSRNAAEVPELIQYVTGKLLENFYAKRKANA